MNRSTTIFAVLACALAAAPAAAQDSVVVQDAAPQEAPAGPTSISLTLDGGGTVGLWRQLSPRVRAGVEVGTSISSSTVEIGELESTGISVQPSVKIFSSAGGSVRPYTTLGVFAGFAKSEADADDNSFDSEISTRSLGANAGVGLEWMPVPRVAIDGHVGVAAGYAKQRLEHPSDDTDEAEQWNVGTFNSGIVIHLFF